MVLGPLHWRSMCLGCIITHDTSSKTGSSEPFAPFACALCPPSRQTPIQALMVVPDSKRRKQGGKKIYKPSRMTIYEPLGSEGWDTRVGVPWPSHGDSALQPLLPSPVFHLAEGISPPLWIKFPQLISLERAQGFVFAAVWRYSGRRGLASSDIWICQQSCYPPPVESAEKAHRAMSVGSYFHQSVKPPAFRQSSSNFKVRLIPHQIITAVPRSTLSPELSIWRRTETYWCPLWKQHGCQAD